MTAVSRRKSVYQNNIVLLFTVSSLFFISQALAVFKTRCQRAPFFFFCHNCSSVGEFRDYRKEEVRNVLLLHFTHRVKATLVRETTRALGGGCTLRSYCFILPIDGAETGALNFAACVKMVSPPMRFFNRVSASYLSGQDT